MFGEGENSPRVIFWSSCFWLPGSSFTVRYQQMRELDQAIYSSPTPWAWNYHLNHWMYVKSSLRPKAWELFAANSSWGHIREDTILWSLVGIKTHCGRSGMARRQSGILVRGPQPTVDVTTQRARRGLWHRPHQVVWETGPWQQEPWHRHQGSKLQS